MNIQNIFTLLCGIQDPWKISQIEINSDEEKIKLKASYKKGSKFVCPHCGGLDFYP